MKASQKAGAGSRQEQAEAVSKGLSHHPLITTNTTIAAIFEMITDCRLLKLHRCPNSYMGTGRFRWHVPCI
jgi:hypothetical protein